MRTRLITAALVTALTTLVAGNQEKPAAEQPAGKPPAPSAAPPRDAGPGVPLKVTVVLSRYQGDKRISSLPYVLGVVTDGPPTTLRMGSDVPIAQTAVSGAKDMPQPYTYRSVGTNIDCQASASGSGLFRLRVTVTDSSVHLTAGDKSAPAAQLSGLPSFRSFNSSFTILLRDGQSTQYTSATDPVSGEVMRIDLTLNVLK